MKHNLPADTPRERARYVSILIAVCMAAAVISALCFPENAYSVVGWIFLWLFLTPFIAVGLAMFATFLSCLAGRTEIRIQRGESVLFTGIGPLSRRKRFATSEVKEVRLEDNRWRDSNGNSRQKAQIIIDLQNKPLKFGSMLSPERRRFVAGALKRELVRA